MSAILSFNKYIVNPVMMNIAGSTNTPFAVVSHTGRKSGKHYKTPIIVRIVDEGFVAALTYGTKVSWYQNILKAQHCSILWHKKKYEINKIESLGIKNGLSAFPKPLSIILKLRGIEDFILLKTK